MYHMMVKKYLYVYCTVCVRFFYLLGFQMTSIQMGKIVHQITISNINNSIICIRGFILYINLYV